MAHHKDRFKLPEQYADIEEPDFLVVDLLRLPDALDIVALRRTVERHAFEEIAAAAKGAAHVVAAAARQAAFARAEQGDAVDAWDAAWARASAPLLKQWREEAIAGKLKVDYSEAAAATSPAGIAQRQRDMQIKAALAAAQSAADEQRGGSPT
ncbi:unnamed protein product [Effrenium voratum]|uniref:Uncharacterized protein n=1 Tax=Effrenium voratum TaxID=2562239 RepID=A0AA36IA17_9DINO|nr:unnamed protein product [Effrenium voratum]